MNSLRKIFSPNSGSSNSPKRKTEAERLQEEANSFLQSTPIRTGSRNSRNSRTLNLDSNQYEQVSEAPFQICTCPPGAVAFPCDFCQAR